jgi:DNA-binding transcriptional MocR family regulator
MNIELKDLSHNPVYVQVRQEIETQIKNKTLAAGEQLPSPAALGQKLSVDKGERNSRSTKARSSAPTSSSNSSG